MSESMVQQVPAPQHSDAAMDLASAFDESVLSVLSQCAYANLLLLVAVDRGDFRPRSNWEENDFSMDCGPTILFARRKPDCEWWLTLHNDAAISSLLSQRHTQTTPQPPAAAAAMND